MILSAERRDGEPVAAAFGTAVTDEGLAVGLLLLNSHAPAVITLEGTAYRVPSAYLEHHAPQQARNITLEAHNGNEESSSEEAHEG